MDNSEVNEEKITQTTRIQKPVIKTSAKVVPVIPVRSKSILVKPPVARAAVPMLKKPKTDTVKLKVYKKPSPASLNPVVKPAVPTVKPVTLTPVVKPAVPTVKPVALTSVVKPAVPTVKPDAVAPVDNETKTTKMVKPVVLTKTVKLSNPIQSNVAELTEKPAPTEEQIAPVTPVASVKPVAPAKAKVIAPVVKKPASPRVTRKKPVAPLKKGASKKQDLSFDVSDFEDDNVEPSILFMLMNIASAVMFVAGLSIALTN